MKQHPVSSSLRRIVPQTPYPVVLSPPSSLPNYLNLHGPPGSPSHKAAVSASASASPMLPASSSLVASGGSAEWEEDFVILCEFSELYGAVEIWHIPEAVELTGFEKEKFLSSIMSVDYQSGKEAGGSFQENTSVAVVDPNSRYTYYAYHFTLLDIQARGYVRPLALVYVTRSTTLVMGHHSELSELFSETVKVLKRYNWVLTHRDIDRMIADLDYTLAELKSGGASFPEGFSEAKLAGLRGRQRDLVELRLRLSRLDRLENAGPTPAIPAEYLPRVEEVFPPEQVAYTPILRTEEHKRRFDKNLRTVEELCGDHPVGLAKYMLARIISRFFQALPAIAEREMEMASVDPQLPEELELCVGGTVPINYGVQRNGGQKRDKDDPGKRAAHKPRHRAGTSSRKNRDSSNVTGNPLFTRESEKVADVPENPQRRSLDSTVKSPLLISHEPVIDEDEDNDSSEDKSKEDENGDTKRKEVAKEERVKERRRELERETKKWEEEEREMCEDPSKDPSLYPPLEIGAYMMDDDTTRMWFYQETIPGNGACLGLYEFISTHSFSQALVYSLLRGRPVIVRARPEKRALVELYVNLLGVFVAGPEGCVVPWHEAPLRLADLARMRLVGVPRKPMVLPRAVERCVTVLNVDSIPETLVAPECPPDAEYVKRLLALGMEWLDEDSYYAHIREELYKIGMWGSLYFNMCCVGTLKMTSNGTPSKKASGTNSNNNNSSSSSSTSKPAEEKGDKKKEKTKKEKSEEGEEKAEEKIEEKEMSAEERTSAIAEALAAAEAGAPSQKAVYTTAPLPLDVRESFKKQFCEDAKMSYSDLAILENFAEVIKLQQATAEPGAFLRVLPVRIDEAKTLVFRNCTK